MSVDPDNSHLSAQTLSDSSTGAHNSANSDGVVPTKSKDETALGSVRIDLGGEGFRDSGNGAGVLHVAVRRVRLGEEGGVSVDFLIVVDGVTEVGGELGEEASGDEGSWGSINAWFTLSKMSVQLFTRGGEAWEHLR